MIFVKSSLKESVLHLPVGKIYNIRTTTRITVNCTVHHSVWSYTYQNWPQKIQPKKGQSQPKWVFYEFLKRGVRV